MVIFSIVNLLMLVFVEDILLNIRCLFKTVEMPFQEGQHMCSVELFLWFFVSSMCFSVADVCLLLEPVICTHAFTYHVSILNSIYQCL